MARIVLNEAEIQRLANGPLMQHLNGLADRVVNQAVVNASGRPGPRIRSGDLVESIQKQPGRDQDGPFIDIGATAEHRGYPYPSRLETGEDGHLYPWLRPALEQTFQGA